MAAATAAWPVPQSRFAAAPGGLQVRPDPATQSDDNLVELARVGDSDAFVELIKRHQRTCLSKAYSISRNLSDAEDDVQGAWIQVWTHLDSYQCQGTFRAWLLRVVTNQCLMRLRKAQSVTMISVDEAFNAQGTYRLELIDRSALPEQSVGGAEVVRVLNEEIGAVPPLLRKVLVMRVLRQLAIQDIADHLGTSIAAAKSRLVRGRAELKKRLGKHGLDRGSSALLQRSEGPRVAYVRQ